MLYHYIQIIVIYILLYTYYYLPIMPNFIYDMELIFKQYIFLSRDFNHLK